MFWAIFLFVFFWLSFADSLLDTAASWSGAWTDMDSLYHIPFTVLLWSDTSALYLHWMPLAWSEHHDCRRAVGPVRGEMVSSETLGTCSQAPYFFPEVYALGEESNLSEQENWMIMVPSRMKGEKMLREIWQCGIIMHHNYRIFQWAFAELSNILKDRNCAASLFFFLTTKSELWALFSSYPLEKREQGLC